ncbi:DUF3347 domain-containing protein [Olivibacter sitiensis]|uniref:DUF3347 domain-containing protein n=1 Tax=Olivibacter sitiensis TaxID=376470 RepID=UPI00146FA672|nr:DUF3347 domain-containing protein [Olivibacter sitiensis]
MRSGIVFFSGIIMLLAIASCGGGQGGNADKAADTTNLASDGVVFDDDSAALILSSYMRVKDALVESDAVKASDEADKLASMLSNYEGCENTSMLAQEIANNHDLAAQRAAFKAVSHDIIGVFEHAPKASGTIYLQHCPMYDENKGGDWLSTSSEIRNPYYGDEMLTCGKVIKEIE